jgi:hypothetical protein
VGDAEFWVPPSTGRQQTRLSKEVDIADEITAQAVYPSRSTHYFPKMLPIRMSSQFTDWWTQKTISKISAPSPRIAHGNRHDFRSYCHAIGLQTQFQKRLHRMGRWSWPEAIIRLYGKSHFRIVASMLF